MGNKPSYEQQYKLHPINPPIMTSENRFVAQQKTVLKLTQNLSITGDSFSITDIQNKPWFQVSRKKLISIKQTKILQDLYGNDILLLKHIWPGYSIESADGGKLVSVRQQNLTQGKFLITAFDKISGQARLLTLKSRHFDRSMAIFIGEEKQNGIPIALIQRNRSFVDSYIVEIAPGVDIPLIVMILMWFNELVQEKRRKKHRG